MINSFDSTSIIAAALAARAAEAAVALLGEPNRQLSSKHELRFGRKGSLSVVTSGAKAGLWYDFEHGVGGDLIDLIKHVHGATFREAASYAEHIIGSVPAVEPSPPCDHNKKTSTNAASELWSEAVAIPNTGAPALYFAHRHLVLHKLDDLSHALRWHPKKSCIIGLMTDAINNVPIGVHRTFLSREGRKIDRKMLGRRGIIRLSTDEEVHEGLGLVEGVEDGLAVMLSGWRPIWVATCAAEILQFRVLEGIEALTIFADSDSVGMSAAEACAARWTAVGKEVCVSPPMRRTPR
jgi:putative DNA primase/helicase